MRSLILLPQAVEDLDQIVDPAYTEILEVLRSLRRFPLLGAPMDGPFLGYRHLVVRLFRVIYRVRPDGTVVVVYIRHGRRALKSP